MHQHENTYIISLGGSLIVPGEIDTEFLSNFRSLIIDQIEKSNRKFMLITGGGQTARRYVNAVSGITNAMTDEDRDWLGIHATRLNAQLVRNLFKGYAYDRINKNPHELEGFYECTDSVMVAAGWRPGASTDYVSTMLARHLGITTIINLSNIDYIYDKDPRKFDDAQKIEDMSWAEFRQMFGGEWKPGLHTPIDPMAAEYAEREDLSVVTIGGDDLSNLQKYLDGEKFEGSIIKNG